MKPPTRQILNPIRMNLSMPRPDDPLWVYIAQWPPHRERPLVSARVAHIWVQLAVACMAEDYGQTRAAGQHAPRCAQCVRWWAGR